MSRIKIISNPYVKSISFLVWDQSNNDWSTLEQVNPDSELRQKNLERSFLPFKALEIIQTLVDEYYTGKEKLEIVFQGTTDEWEEMESICYEERFADKIDLSRDQAFLENARDILDSTKEVFEEVHPIIRNIFRENDESSEAESIRDEMKKVVDSMDAIIPICVFGNYSAGKSTFINALIGNEVLPSGGDPVTAKVYEIRRSKYVDRAIVSFDYGKDQAAKERFRLIFDSKECRVQEGNPESEIIEEVMRIVNETSIVEMPVQKRRFMMGNALVVNLIEQMEPVLDEIVTGEPS